MCVCVCGGGGGGEGGHLSSSEGIQESLCIVFLSHSHSLSLSAKCERGRKLQENVLITGIGPSKLNV